MKLKDYVDKILNDRKRVYHDYAENVKGRNDEAAYVYERLEELIDVVQSELINLEEYPSDGSEE